MLTSFNVVLLTTIDDVKDIKDRMTEGGATMAQIGHFYVQDRPARQSQGTIKM